MKNNCSFCEDVNKVLNKNIANLSDFIIELETGYVSLGRNQYYKGYCLFICKKHGNELHKLPEKFRKMFLYEMTIVSEAIFNAFKPMKLNYELLGNSHSHLHWHILPRYKNDILPKIPVWNNPDFLMNKVRLIDDEKKVLKNKLLKEIGLILKRNSIV